MSHPSDSNSDTEFGRDPALADPLADANDLRSPLPERSRLPHPPFSAGEQQSFIDEHSTFSGKYESSHNLLVEGTVEGEIACDGRLIVAQAAIVKARITAADITVAGTLDGEITCHGLLEVLPTGRVQGTLTTERLVVQDGAFCDGTIHMQAREPGEAAESADHGAGESTGTSGKASPTSIFKTPVRKVE